MRPHTVAAWLTSLAVVSFSFSISFAQPPALPNENHYKTYECTAASIFKLIGLKDQFGTVSVTTATLTKFATPVRKDEYPIIEQDAHQTWWRISAPQTPRTVEVIDQFGEAPWTVADAVFLVTPAKKYPVTGDTPPVRNHYLCYAAIGPNPNRFVVLTDQFGTQTVFVGECKFFCNPVEKTVDGVVYPIIDGTAHLACYMVDNPAPTGQFVTALDQFGSWQFDLGPNQCLCNPALKREPLGTKQSTWGNIKALYR